MWDLRDNVVDQATYASVDRLTSAVLGNVLGDIIGSPFCSSDNLAKDSNNNNGNNNTLFMFC